MTRPVAEHPHGVFEELTPPLARDAALVEADRCLECGGPHAAAPCVMACPAGVDVPAFVAAVSRDEPDEAARIIFAENLLGGTCSRVCPVELLCEGACVLGHEGRKPVAVGLLERFATDHALGSGVHLRERAPFNWLRIAVIGAGPAGLACAGELASLGYAVTVYDERLEPGGLVRYAIAPYRLYAEPLSAEARVLAELGVSFELGVAIDTPEALASVAEEADAVVLAVGRGPGAEFLAWIDGLELEHGAIVVDPLTGATTSPSYFAAGDATNGGATVVQSVREAKIAARGVHEFLGRGWGTKEIRREARAGQGSGKS